MERYNPFSSSNIGQSNSSSEDEMDNQERMNSFEASAVNSLLKRSQQQQTTPTRERSEPRVRDAPATPPGAPSKYSVSFPDPFEGQEVSGTVRQTNRSNSINLSTASHSVDETPSSPFSSGRQRNTQPGGGLGSFLYRATSVTSSSVSDRVSGAVGSVKSAVDSLSSQIQSAVPVNLNEKISSTADQLQQQQQSTASYLASKISSATGQFSSSGQTSTPPLQISRQRVILILDNFANTDWPHQFNQYRRMLSGQSSTQSALSSFFTSATAQLGGSSSLSYTSEPADLIEQADYKDVSVLASQSSSTATVYIAAGSKQTSGLTRSTQIMPARIVRPEFVVVKQCAREKPEHLKSIVYALNYCLVPLFEPVEFWNVFQSRQMVFAILLRVQRQLGKENFPLIPQVYCQTQQDLLNYINSSTISLPCLVRMGNGRIKIDQVQGLRDFASIMATSHNSCTIEQYLEVEYDLIIQKLGTSLKLFRRSPKGRTISRRASGIESQREQATRQTSIGMLSSFISSNSSSSQSQQLQQQQQQQTSQQVGSPHQAEARRDSGPQTQQYLERVSEVGSRYKNWIEAVSQEFDNKLDMFSLKVCVASGDREYIVGLGNCTADFVGSVESQEEDKRRFVELISSKVNTMSPKNQLSRNSSYNLPSSSGTTKPSQTNSSPLDQMEQDNISWKPLGDKKKFISQSQIDEPRQSGNRTFGQLSSRSQSVSINQTEYVEREQNSNLVKSPHLNRRSSERADSINMESVDDMSQYVSSSSTTTTPINSTSIHQRQASLGQSFFDQTSTALSSFQKQSLSFFKRLDSRSGFEFGSSTPPQSAKSDKAFDRSFASGINAAQLASSVGATPQHEPPAGSSLERAHETQSRARDGFKSQSIDSSGLDTAILKRQTSKPKPPKPPPPLTMANRQSSLATYSESRPKACTTPSSTPTKLASVDHVKKSANFDSASITSGDSNSTGEMANAEDTMNNLKKTFASIFGDKCE